MLGAITCTAEMRPNLSFHRITLCADELNGGRQNESTLLDGRYSAPWMGRSSRCRYSDAGGLLLAGITAIADPKRPPWWDAGSLLWTTPFNRCNFYHGSRRSPHSHTPVALVGSCPARGHLCFPVCVLVVGP
jgi:hypothetical protein